MPDYLDFDAAIAELEAGDPPHAGSGFLGSRLHPDDAALILLPVPWEATASYGSGSSLAPQAIIRASHQLDLEDSAFGDPYRAGIAFLSESMAIHSLNKAAKQAARQVMEALESGAELPDQLEQVNTASAEVNGIIRQLAGNILDQGKRVGLVGGDHSSPFGLIEALARHHPDGFGILHIDAHHDLRRAYAGFSHSHASIFYNVMEQIPEVKRLVQVGIRDYCRSERDYLASLGERGRCFYDADCSRRQFQGEPFAHIVNDIIEALPERVYISFDIDGLEPGCCPSTGTPVTGGLSFRQACYLLEELAVSGRQVIGFDLCEVTPSPDGGDWDANVGARILYKLCGCLLKSQE